MSAPEVVESGDASMPRLIACGGVVLHAYGLPDRLNEALASSTQLIEVDSPYSSAPHIKRLEMATSPAQSDKDMEAVLFKGVVMLDDKKTVSSVFRTGNKSFSTAKIYNRSIRHTERIGGVHAFEIAHIIGMALIMYATVEGNCIVVSNASPGRVGGRLYLPTDPTELSLESQFGAFADAFFHTLDYVGSIKDNDPRTSYITGSFDIGSKLVGDEAKHAEPAEYYLSDVQLDDIAGLEATKRRLRELAHGFSHPEDMAKWNVELPSGILLVGPPGTGKSMLIDAFANETESTQWYIQAHHIHGSASEEAGSVLAQEIAKIKSYDGRGVVILDAIDVLAGVYSSYAVASSLRQELAWLTESRPDILVLATARNIDNIHPLLRGKGALEVVLQTSLPDKLARLQILANAATALLPGQEDTVPLPSRENIAGLFDKDVDMLKFANLTDGMSGGDIAQILHRLRLKKAIEESRTQQISPINQQDIDTVIAEFRQENPDIRTLE